MAMDLIAQLVACATATAADIKTFVTACQDNISGNSGKPIRLPQDAPIELRQTKQCVLTDVVELQRLLMGPADLLQQLACHAQLLACLHWLGHFQVLACIPQYDSAAFKDIADLAGVPESQLSRIVRMTATFGFLYEPEPGRVAHSALSAGFVNNLPLLDAVMFLASTAVPAALHMPASTQRFHDSPLPSETAYNMASNSSASFSNACEQRSQLRRQWSAFWQYGTTNVDGTLVDLLNSLQCAERLRAEVGAVVEIGARSTTQAMLIAKQFPLLQIFVQVKGTEPKSQSEWPKLPGCDALLAPTPLEGRVTVQQLPMNSPQPVRDAVVYILHLNSLTTGSGAMASEHILEELKHLVAVLKSNNSATLILTSGVIPELGSVNARVEARARLRDLTLFQLTNQKDIEMSDIMKILNKLSDNAGRLVLANKHCSPRSGDLALEIQYQAFARG